MGLLAIIADALGLRAPLKAAEPQRLHVGASAAKRLAGLPGTALHLQLVPAERGYLVRAWEAPAPSSPSQINGVPVVVAGEDLDRMRGLQIQWAEDRYTVQLDLDVRPAPTPNPSGRMYATNRTLCLGRPIFATQDHTDCPPLVAALLAHESIASVLLRDHTLTITRHGDLPWSRLDAVVTTALREHFLACGGPAEAPAGDDDDELDALVRRVIAERILPGVHRDGGNIELIDVTDGVVHVHMEGACRNCPASTVTLQQGVLRVLQEELPSRIRAVVQV